VWMEEPDSTPHEDAHALSAQVMTSVWRFRLVGLVELLLKDCLPFAVATGPRNEQQFRNGNAAVCSRLRLCSNNYILT